MDEDFLKLNGWTKVYHPSGLQVTLPVPSDPGMAFAHVSGLIETGWLVNAPSLEAGEQIEDIAYVVRKSKANDDESETPIIDVYTERGNYRVVGVYLNTPQDVESFCAIANVKLADLPYYEGDGTIERGKGPKTDKYIFKLPHPVKMVWKLNPRYEGPEDKKHAKRVFVRWLDTGKRTEEKPALSQAALTRWSALVANAKQYGVVMNFEITPDDTLDTLTERAGFIKAEIDRKAKEAKL